MNRPGSLITSLAVAAAALTVGPGAGPAAAEPPWMNALNARSEALNELYGLGSNARNPAGAMTPAWLRALMIRSDGLNRLYELGDYAPES